MKKASTNFLTNLAFVTISIIITVLIAEGVLYAIKYQKRPHSWIFQNEEFIQEGEYSNFYTLDKDLIYKPRNKTVVVPNYWEIDNLGYRLNPEHENSGFDKKILVLGDSFAYGHGVSHRKAWTAQLETIINKNGYKVRVYNAGMPATGTDQHFVRLQKEISKLDPDTVIWMVTVNDIDDSNFFCLYKLDQSNNYQRIPGYYNVAYINAFLVKYLPNFFVKTNFGNLLTTLSVDGKDAHTFGCTEDLPHDHLEAKYFHKLAFIVNSAKSLAKEKNIRLIFLITPLQVYFDRNYDNQAYEVRMIQQIRNVLEENRVEYIDLNVTIASNQDAALLDYRSEQNNQISASSSTSAVLGVDMLVEDLNRSLYLDESASENYGGWHLNEKGNGLVSQIISGYLLGKQ